MLYICLFPFFPVYVFPSQLATNMSRRLLARRGLLVPWSPGPPDGLHKGGLGVESGRGHSTVSHRRRLVGRTGQIIAASAKVTAYMMVGLRREYAQNALDSGLGRIGKRQKRSQTPTKAK